MKLKLIRTFKGEEYTIGKLYVDDNYFCDTLEDPTRDVNKNGVFDGDEKKIYGQTAIPYGTYRVTLSYSSKFKRRLPEILKVPHFTGIRIHRGNYPKDTLGCILVGENKVKGQVINSTKYETKLVNLLAEVQRKGNPIDITIM